MPLNEDNVFIVSTKNVLLKLVITYIFNLSLRADLSQPQEGPLDARRKKQIIHDRMGFSSTCGE